MQARRDRLLACGVILVGWALRLVWLTTSPIWYDESFTLINASHGPWRALLDLGRLDNAPPLYGMLLSVWVALFGNGEFVVRFFSALLGMITLPLIGRWAGALTGRRIEWGPMLFVATCPLFVRYGYEVRMYALAIALAAAFGWAAWQLLTGSLRRRSFFVLSGLAMLLAHPYTAFLWAVFLVIGFILWVRKRLSAPRWWWSANLYLGAAAVPIAGWMLWRAQVDATAYGPVPIEPSLFRYLLQYTLVPFLEPLWGYVTIGVLVLSAFGGLVRLAWQRRWSACGLLGLGLILPVLMLLAVCQFKGKWGPQYLLPSWGMALALSTGLGWSFHGPKAWGRALALTGAVLALIWLGAAIPSIAEMNRGNWRILRDEFNPRPDFRSLARYIEAHDAPGDAILVIAGMAAHTMAYYYHGEAPIIGLPETFVLDTRHPIELRHLRDVEERIGPAQRLWLVLWTEQFVDPTNQVLDTLLERCARLPVGQNFTNAALLLFDLTGCRPLDTALVPPHSIQALFGELELLGHDLRIENGRIILSLWWAAKERPARDYSTFVHLMRDGELIGQDDQLLGTWRFPTSLWEPGTVIKTHHEIPLPPEECAGCQVFIGLYDREQMLTGSGLGRVFLPDGNDHITLELPLDSSYTEPWPLDVRFGPLKLIGYRLSIDISACLLTLWWQSLAPMTANYSAFAHLVCNDTVVSQEDRLIGNEAFPTNAWSVGTIKRTRHRIPLPPQGYQGCALVVGVYDYQEMIQTGGLGRVPLEDGSLAFEIPLP